VGPGLITLDTSALFALLNRRDPDHELVKRVFLDDGGPYLVPAGILAEIGYLVEQRLGLEVLDAFLEDLEQRALALECGEDELPRVRALVRRYADLPLGFADASVVACAERHGGAVLTLDLRHFGVVSREGTIAVLPAPA
jgi:predicted nucleic acid-binding protein